MSAHFTAVVKAFYDVCNQAYAGWRIHKILFDDNPRKKELERSEARHALMHFSIVSQESLLLQIAKLHDPAIMQGHITLGVEYMVRYGGWDKSTETELQTLQVQLNELAMKIRPARHKILSQNDLEAILSGATLGDFQTVRTINTSKPCKSLWMLFIPILSVRLCLLAKMQESQKNSFGFSEKKPAKISQYISSQNLRPTEAKLF